MCGGLIHPIAGKCKHCKAELASFHAPRPAAAAPLPSLRTSAGAAPITPAPAAPSSGQVHWIGKPQASGEPAPTASTPASARDASQPVLPPRPTARGHVAEPHDSSWRSWPVVVIVLAMVAIVAAVVLMVLPAGHDEDRGKRATTSAPAPDRMQTAPDVTPPAPTPKAAPSAPAPAPAPSPAAPPDQDPWADPDSHAGSGSSADNTLPDPDDNDLVDPFSSPPQATPPRPGNRHRLNLNANAAMMMTMAAHLCRKMAQCGSSDLATLQICNTLAAQAPALPTNCPAAARCVKLIDSMNCANQSGDLSQIPTLFAQFVDCGAAAQC